MKTVFQIIFISVLSCSTLLSQDASLTKLQAEEIFELLISEIETIDAEAIKTRNSSKDVKWEEWVQSQKANFTKSRKMSELKEAFYSFSKGFVNAHARSTFTFPLEEKPKSARQASTQIAYTFPEIHFYEISSKLNIKKINDLEVEKLSHYYKNYECRGSSELSCAWSFQKAFSRGTLKVNGEEIRSITLENGGKLSIDFKEIEPTNRYQELTEAIYAENLYQTWNLIKAGYKVAVWTKDDMALVRIKNFIYPKGSDGGLRCSESAADSTQCGDILVIRDALTEIRNEVQHLILDVQGNPGGNENSRFIAELCPKPFKDLAVQYRKTSFLEDPELRNHLFYYSDRTENWYQSMKTNGIYKETPQGSFFPPIADFCQGSEECALEFIEPNPTAKHGWSSITVLVNEGTASSGDDFTFRMKSYAGANVVGQTQSADLSYSLVTLFIYIDPAGQVRKQYYGNNAHALEVEGTPLFTFDIPFSRSVDSEGNLLQGNPLKLDLLVPLTKENFNERHNHTLQKAIENLKK